MPVAGFNVNCSYQTNQFTMANLQFLKVSCIYKISSVSKTDHFYIGSAINFKNRRRQHFNELKRNNHWNKKLQRHCNKYGINDLVMTVLELVSEKENLINREQHYIDSLNPYFNICKTAGNTLGVKRTPEERQKISEKRKGTKLTDEHKNKISEGLKTAQRKPCVYKPYPSNRKPTRNRLGVKISEETRAKMQAAQKGRVITIEARQKLREFNLGKVVSEEVRNKIKTTLMNRGEICKCPQCGGDFRKCTNSKKFCSKKCRLLYNRNNHKICLQKI